MKLRFQILLISAVVLAVYYPAIFAEFNQVDDIGMIRSLEQLNGWPLKEFFLPGHGSGLYYRPLLILSFAFDKHFWALDSGFMHLENILLHLFNSLLVFFLSRELLSGEEAKVSRLPLISALIFGLHPVNVESVSWVSGRTDPLACLFVLVGAILLVRFRKTDSLGYLAAATAVLFLGFISKESALGFLLGGMFFVIAKVDGNSSPTDSRSRSRFIPLLLMALAILGCVALFFVFRSFAFTSNKSNIGMTLKYMEVNPLYSSMLMLRTFGFYLSKIFWPFPLNFAIVQIDPIYELFAIPAFFLSLWIAWRRTILSALYLAGIGLMIPSFVIAFGQIAWTPFSERYVYMASAFIITASVHFLSKVCNDLDKKPLVFHLKARPAEELGSPENGGFQISGKAVSLTLLAVIMPVWLFGTYERNLVWRTNLSLYEDTARKVQDFNEVRNMHGVALFRKGDLKGAEREMLAASSLYSFTYDEKFDLNHASVLSQQGKYAQGLKVIQKVMKKSEGKSVRAFEELILLLQEQYRASALMDKTAIKAAIEENCEKLYNLDPDADLLYAMGKTALSLNAKDKARKYFMRAYEKFPQGSQYRDFSGRILKRLGNGIV